MSGGDILREVDEALRVEKAMRFWHDHGKTIIVIIAFIILGTAVQSGWSSYIRHENEVATSQYLDAFQDKDPLAALGKLNDKQTGSGSALAGLSAASLALDKEDWASAISAYEKVRANGSAPLAYQDLASVMLATIKIDHDPKATSADLLNLIAPIARNKESVWYTKALLTSGLIKANKGGDFEAARKDFAILLEDKNLPSTFAQQIRALDNICRIKAQAKSGQK